MTKSNSHNKNHITPPPKLLPVLEKMIDAYKLWHELLPHTPKTTRYTLCSKIDSLFTDVLKNIATATYQKSKSKENYINKAITSLDLLKFFLRVAWEIKSIDNKKYITFSEDLDEVGRMLGGWLKHLKENSR